eukprot:8173665-Alexandrium_andersonii.AAC.1
MCIRDRLRLVVDPVDVQAAPPRRREPLLASEGLLLAAGRAPDDLRRKFKYEWALGARMLQTAFALSPSNGHGQGKLKAS